MEMPTDVLGRDEKWYDRQDRLVVNQCPCIDRSRTSPRLSTSRQNQERSMGYQRKNTQKSVSTTDVVTALVGILTPRMKAYSQW